MNQVERHLWREYTEVELLATEVVCIKITRVDPCMSSNVTPNNITNATSPGMI